MGPIDAGSLYGRVMAAHTMTRDIASWGGCYLCFKKRLTDLCVSHTPRRAPQPAATTPCACMWVDGRWMCDLRLSHILKYFVRDSHRPNSLAGDHRVTRHEQTHAIALTARAAVRNRSKPVEKWLTSCRGRPPPCVRGSGPCGARRSGRPSGRVPARAGRRAVSTRGAGREGGREREGAGLERAGLERAGWEGAGWEGGGPVGGGWVGGSPPRQSGLSSKARPRTASRRTVDGWPMCWWLPPPCGCSTGFIATPRTVGQEFRFTRYLWKARPAFSSGLSMRPPPATMPTAPRAFELTSFFCPDGRRRRVFPVFSMWPMI